MGERSGRRLAGAVCVTGAFLTGGGYPVSENIVAGGTFDSPLAREARTHGECDTARCLYDIDMDDKAYSVDQAALAGVGVAGAISISSAEGVYTPLDSTLGVVLLILFVGFRRPQKAQKRSGIRFLAAQAAVLAILGCMILGPVVEIVSFEANFPALPEPMDEGGFPVDSLLACVWAVLFLSILAATWLGARYAASAGEASTAPVVRRDHPADLRPDAVGPTEAAGPQHSSSDRLRAVPPIGELWTAAKKKPLGTGTETR